MNNIPLTLITSKRKWRLIYATKAVDADHKRFLPADLLDEGANESRQYFYIRLLPEVPIQGNPDSILVCVPTRYRSWCLSIAGFLKTHHQRAIDDFLNDKSNDPDNEQRLLESLERALLRAIKLTQPLDDSVMAKEERQVAGSRAYAGYLALILSCVAVSAVTLFWWVQSNGSIGQTSQPSTVSTKKLLVSLQQVSGDVKRLSERLSDIEEGPLPQGVINRVESVISAKLKTIESSAASDRDSIRYLIRQETAAQLRHRPPTNDSGVTDSGDHVNATSDRPSRSANRKLANLEQVAAEKIESAPYASVAVRSKRKPGLDRVFVEPGQPGESTGTSPAYKFGDEVIQFYYAILNETATVTNCYLIRMNRPKPGGYEIWIDSNENSESLVANLYTGSERERLLISESLSPVDITEHCTAV